MNVIVEHLKGKYGNAIKYSKTLPSPYFPGGVKEVRAIYLGCDPSNKHSTDLPYAFAHQCNLKVFNSFIKAHTEQLAAIGLCWEHVYTQNLCQNYFQKETYSNKRLFKKVALEFWIEKLKTELEQFDKNIPVLLTSQILLEVLGDKEFRETLAPDFYECKVPIPIPAENNLLGRPLIPVYRGKSPRYNVSYLLKNDKWKKYKTSIIKTIKHHEENIHI